MSDLLGDAHIAKLGIAGLRLNDRRHEFGGRAFRTGFAARRRGGKEQAACGRNSGHSQASRHAGGKAGMIYCAEFVNFFASKFVSTSS